MSVESSSDAKIAIAQTNLITELKEKLDASNQKCNELYKENYELRSTIKDLSDKLTNKVIPSYVYDLLGRMISENKAMAKIINCETIMNAIKAEEEYDIYCIPKNSLENNSMLETIRDMIKAKSTFSTIDCDIPDDLPLAPKEFGRPILSDSDLKEIDEYLKREG